MTTKVCRKVEIINCSEKILSKYQVIDLRSAYFELGWILSSSTTYEI